MGGDQRCPTATAPSHQMRLKASVFHSLLEVHPKQTLGHEDSFLYPIQGTHLHPTVSQGIGAEGQHRTESQCLFLLTETLLRHVPSAPLGEGLSQLRSLDKKQPHQPSQAAP